MKANINPLSPAEWWAQNLFVCFADRADHELKRQPFRPLLNISPPPATASMTPSQAACAIALAMGAAFAAWVVVLKGSLPHRLLPSLDACAASTLLRSDLCAVAFAGASQRPCALGKYSTLCLDFPTALLSASRYRTACETVTERQARVQILGGRVHIVKPAESSTPSEARHSAVLRAHVRHIAHASQLHRLPDVDFLLDWSGGSAAWPVFAPSSPSAWRADPSSWADGNRTYFVPCAAGWPTRRLVPAPNACEAPSAAERDLWTALNDTAVFRGPATGPKPTEQSWRANVRAQLAFLSNLFPDWLDAKLSGLQHAQHEAFDGYLASSDAALHLAQVMAHKYAMHVDGDAHSDRLASLLLAGRLVLSTAQHDVSLTASLHRLPHVITVRPDLRDLMTILHCLREHPDLALRRARLGARAARELITYENAVLHYWADLLEHYAAQQHFTVEKHARAIDAESYFVSPGADLVFPYKSYDGAAGHLTSEETARIDGSKPGPWLEPLLDAAGLKYAAQS
jgi:hypothetical protein